MSELSPEARALFRAARQVGDPPDDAQARVRQALQAQLALKAAGAGAAGAGATGAAVKYLAAVAVAVTATWGAVGSGTRAPSGSHPAPHATHAAPRTTLPEALAPARPPANSPVAAESVPPSPPAAPPPLARPRLRAAVTPPTAPAAPAPPAAPREPAPVVAAPAPTAGAPPPPAEVAALEVAAQVRLLSTARDAVRANDGARALAALDEWQRRFPGGALATEASAVRVLALCAQGRVAEARALAHDWFATSGRSPLAAGLRRSCAADVE